MVLRPSEKGHRLPEQRQAQSGKKGRTGRKVNFVDGRGFSFQAAFGGKLGFFPARIKQVLHRQANAYRLLWRS